MIIKILRNSLFLLSGQILAKLLTLLCFIFLARRLGVEGFGFYGTVMTYLTLFATFADVGMSTVTIREVAQDHARSNQYFTHVLTLRIIVTAGLYACLVALGGLWQSPRYPVAFVAGCGLFLFPEAIRKSGRAMLSAYERMDLISILEVVSTIFRYIPFFIVILSGKSLYTAFFLLVLSWIITAGMWLVITMRYCLPQRMSYSLDIQELRKILQASYPFAILAILSVIYFKIDISMLAYMQGDEAVGFYEGAYKFIEAAFFIPVSIVNVLLPAMSRSFATDKVSYENLYVHATRILTIGMLPVAVLVTFFSKEIILLVLKEPYLPSVPALSVLIWALFFMFVNAPVGNIIATSRKIHAFLPYAIANTLFNVVLNVFLIPRYSFLGAAVATVLSEVLAFAIQLYFAHRILGNAASVLRMLTAVLLAGGCASMVFYSINPYVILPLKILAFLAIYVGGLFVVKAIRHEDIHLFHTILSIAKTKIQSKTAHGTHGKTRK